MAKQKGFIQLTGCYGNICFYKLNGGYYARMKSSLNRERMKRDPAFANTMKYAQWMAKASQISSEVYRTFPKEMKSRKVYQKLTGRILLMIKDGISTEVIHRVINSGV